MSRRGAGADTNVDTLLIPPDPAHPVAAPGTARRGRHLRGRLRHQRDPDLRPLPAFVAIAAALLIVYSAGREPDRAGDRGLVCVLAGLIAIGLTDPVVDEEEA